MNDWREYKLYLKNRKKVDHPVNDIPVGTDSKRLQKSGLTQRKWKKFTSKL